MTRREAITEVSNKGRIYWSALKGRKYPYLSIGSSVSPPLKVLHKALKVGRLGTTHKTNNWFYWGVYSRHELRPFLEELLPYTHAPFYTEILIALDYINKDKTAKTEALLKDLPRRGALATLIKYYMLQAGISQVKLSVATAIPSGTIACFTAGDMIPHPDRATLIEQALGLPKDAIRGPVILTLLNEGLRDYAINFLSREDAATAKKLLR